MQKCKNKKPVCAFSKLRPYAVFDKISLQRLQRTESEIVMQIGKIRLVNL